MVSRGTAVLMAGERRPLGFVSKRQRTLRSAAPAAAGRRGGCPRSSASLGLRAELFCARAAFAGSRRILSWDTEHCEPVGTHFGPENRVKWEHELQVLWLQIKGSEREAVCIQGQ